MGIQQDPQSGARAVPLKTMPPPGMEKETGPIQVIRESLGVIRFVMPMRELRKARKGGWVLVLFGLLVVAFMVFWMWGPISGGLRTHGLGRWLGIGFGLLGLPGLAVGFGLMALGSAILTNASHAEVTIGDGLICAVEKLGGITIRRSRFVTQVKRLVVEKGGITTTDKAGVTRTILPDMAMLKAELTAGNPFVLTLGYPSDIMRALADRLAVALPGDIRAGIDGHAAAATVDVVEHEAGAVAEDAEAPMPAGTDITFRAEVNGLAISVPPRGLWKGSQGLFFFSLFWNGFMLVFTVAMFHGKAPMPAFLFILVFWIIGLGLLAGAIEMARRRVLLAVVNDVLAYRVTSPFRTTEKRFALADIDTVRVGPSGMEVNDRPVMELQIVPRRGKKVGLLPNRSREEQEWLAWVLRQQLAGR